jgi:hypothetical protein
MVRKIIPAGRLFTVFTDESEEYAEMYSALFHCEK